MTKLSVEYMEILIRLCEVTHFVNLVLNLIPKATKVLLSNHRHRHRLFGVGYDLRAFLQNHIRIIS